MVSLKHTVHNDWKTLQFSSAASHCHPNDFQKKLQSTAISDNHLLSRTKTETENKKRGEAFSFLTGEHFYSVLPQTKVFRLHGSFLSPRRKIAWKHFLSSKISLWCPFITPALMAVNYADKVSAVKTVSQTRKDKTSWSSHIISAKQEITLNSPSTSLGEEQNWVLKSVLAVKMERKQPWLILRRAIVTLMIHGVYFFCLVPLTLTHSDQALRKLRITSALFVCWKGRMQGTETLFLERSRQGHLPEVSAKQTDNQLLSPPCRI